MVYLEGSAGIRGLIMDRAKDKAKAKAKVDFKSFFIDRVLLYLFDSYSIVAEQK